MKNIWKAASLTMRLTAVDAQEDAAESEGIELLGLNQQGHMMMRVTATHRRSSFAIHVCEVNVNSVKSKSIYAARARNITAHSVGQRSQLKEDASTSEKMMNAIQNLAMHAPFALNAPPAMRSSAKIVPLFVMSAQGHTAMYAMVMSSNIHVVLRRLCGFH